MSLPSDESIDRTVRFIKRIAEEEGIGFWDVLMKTLEDPEYNDNMLEKAKAL